MPSAAEKPIIEAVKSELEDAESSPASYEITTYPADFTLWGLYEKWKAEEIEVPPFQRKFIWTLKQASRLIESFLLGLPVPGIFLYTDKKTGNFLVIDGQQRLNSIFYFFEGFFGAEDKDKRRVFRLTGLDENSPWNGRTFEDLKLQDERSAKCLQNAVLRAFVVKQLNPKDDTSIVPLFERLNTGGTLLRGQEVRNCVYAGSFNELLKELNKNAAWRNILGKKSLDTHMRDVELILRFLAFSEALPNYKKPMKEFLSKFMYRNKDASELVINRYRTLFVSVVNAVHTQLGSRPFHIHTALNAAVYDAVFVALAHADPMPSDLRARYKRLKQNKDFMECTISGTTADAVVRQRIAVAKEVLLGQE
jgi:hypothetical protein